MPWLGAFVLASLLAPATARAQATCQTDAAEGIWRQLDATLRALPPGGDVAPAQELLRDLLADPCFARAHEATRTPVLESALSARSWWEVGGGSWLWQYLHPARLGEKPAIILPPDELPALTAETAPRDHPLRPLLCPAGDGDCGRETAGWVLRAADAFEAHRLSEDARQPDEAHGRDAILARCRTEAAAAAEDRRYATWYACVDARLPRQSVLPLGRFRAPSRGWLVLHGRRGHYGFCDEVRAYDLATGAAWVASSCSGLALRANGSVDQVATDSRRNASLVTGTVPLDALREAAFAILLKEHVVERARRYPEHVELPEGLRPSWSADHLVGMGFGSFWMSSAQTTLGWSWVDRGRVLAEGQLRWPDSSRAAENHAASLVRIAEAALEEGCPPAALPRWFDVATSRAAVSPIDADPTSRQRLEDTLTEQLRRHRPAECGRR